MKKLSMFIAALSLLTTVSVWAHTPLGALAVDVSPDGKTIVAAGDSRVLYVIDAATLEIKQRVWLKSSIWGISFTNDGKKLLAEDTDSTVFFIDTQNWTIEKEQSKCGYLTPAAKVDLCAVLSGSKEVTVMAMTDGSFKGKVTFDKDIASFAINPDGTKLAIVSKEQKDDSEPTVKSNEIPADLKGIARKEFERKNDGKTSEFALFEIPSGKELSRVKIYYTTNAGAPAVFDGDNVVLVNYSSENARITPKGEVTMFDLKNSYNYGIGFSNDGTLLGTGGLSDGTYTKISGLQMLSFRIDKLPGWPEYFKSFAFASDGTLYGTTTGYRLIKIKPDGSIEKSIPVY